jgi:hypothetical protein
MDWIKLAQNKSSSVIFFKAVMKLLVRSTKDEEFLD